MRCLAGRLCSSDVRSVTKPYCQSNLSKTDILHNLRLELILASVHKDTHSNILKLPSMATLMPSSNMLGLVATVLLGSHACFAFNLPLTMSIGNYHSPTPAGRGDYLKKAAIGLLGASIGIGILGQPTERVSAAESQIETCERLMQVVRIGSVIWK